MQVYALTQKCNGFSFIAALYNRYLRASAWYRNDTSVNRFLWASTWRFRPNVYTFTCIRSLHKCFREIDYITEMFCAGSLSCKRMVHPVTALEWSSHFKVPSWNFFYQSSVALFNLGAQGLRGVRWPVVWGTDIPPDNSSRKIQPPGNSPPEYSSSQLGQYYSPQTAQNPTWKWHTV